MNLRKTFSLVEEFLVLVIITFTAIVSIFLLFLYYTKGEPRYTKTGLEDLYFFLINDKFTFIISSILFLFIILLTIGHYAKREENLIKENSRNKYIFVSQAFLFIFLILSLLSSTLPSETSIINRSGTFGLATTYEQTTLVIMGTIALFSFILTFFLNSKKDSKRMDALIKGDKNISALKYAYDIAPALASTLLFYVSFGISAYESIFYFLIFLVLFMVAQRYGVVISFLVVFLAFGSSIIELTFVSVTSIVYPILLLSLAFMGFVSSFLLGNRPIQSKDSGSRNIDSNIPQDASMGNGEGLNQTVQGKNAMKDSREMASQLYIRGVCLNCDSVEFYYTNYGMLQCKKCKSEWSGKETQFQSFKVTRNKNVRA
jgi:ribosomal protein L37AE/L43A